MAFARLLMQYPSARIVRAATGMMLHGNSARGHHRAPTEVKSVAE
jgi:hypothetical protein